MEPRFPGFSTSSNRIPMGNQSMIDFSSEKLPNGSKFEFTYPDQKLGEERRYLNNFQQHNYGGVQFLPNEDPFSSNNIATSSSVGIEDDYQEDCDLSDAILRYINQTLMEEDMEDKTHMLQESLDLQAKEKSFYDVLGKKYPPSPEQILPFIGRYGESVDDYSSGVHLNSTTSSSDASGYLHDLVDPRRINGYSNSPMSSLGVSYMYNESQSFWNFAKGVEEANKFLPNGDKLLVNRLPFEGQRGECYEKKDEDERLPSESRGKKNSHKRDEDLEVEEEEERSSKQPSISTESDIPVEELSIMLLHTMGDGKKKLAEYRDDLRNATSKSLQKNIHTKASRGKGRGKKQTTKKEVIDLRTLLINCAQSVAADDPRSAQELLKQIRQHSSPFGDGNQRLSFYFADGLEARLAGTGSKIHKALVSRRTTAADYLKAYHLYLASSPFGKISTFASNKTIQIKAEKATRLHIIDFGILYGVQWPTLLQRISRREGGPPKIRITGVEFPQPGFKPAERIEETGRRLAYYAEFFNVPFEYNAIAQKWETIKIEDLKIEEDEFLVINCLYRTKNLLDETVMADSPRTRVLNLFRKINPDIFIHEIVNGAYSAPFFVTRFREVLFHFSALFDMLEVNVPREKPERLLIERDIFGREALNVIACEGWERVERPETYKQWHVRNMKAGFSQIPFERELMERARQKVRTSYHKDFVIDEDGRWLLLGWKGRIIFALSCWTSV